MKEESTCVVDSYKSLAEHIHCCQYAKPETLGERFEVDLLSLNGWSEKDISSRGNDFPGVCTNEGTLCVVDSYESLTDPIHCCQNAKPETLGERFEVDLLNLNGLIEKPRGNDFPGVCTNEGTLCVVESYESLFEQCCSNPKLEQQRDDYLNGSLMIFKQEPDIDRCLTEENSSRLCIDDGTSDVESYERRHFIVKPEDLDNDDPVEMKQHWSQTKSGCELSAMALNSRSSAIGYSADKKLSQRLFVTLRKLDCLRCYEQSQSSNDRPEHGRQFASSSSSMKCEEPRQLANFLSETTDQSCLLSEHDKLQAKKENDRRGPQQSTSKNGSKANHGCEVCGNVCPSRSALKRHMRSHTGEKPYVCDECGKSFAYSCGLSSHKQERHTENEKASGPTNKKIKLLLTCNHCEKLFSSRGSLRNHLIRFTSKLSEISHECVYCGKVFLRADYLKRHMRSHTGEDGGKPDKSAAKPYVCDHCGKAYTRSDRLKLHVRVDHTGNDKIHRCTHVGCNKAFNRSDYLTVHMRYHSNEKPYICSDCGSTYVSKNVLMQHMRGAHGTEKPCDVSVTSVPDVVSPLTGLN